MRNIHLDFLQRVRLCDPTGGFATMGVIMAVGMAGGAVSAYGSAQEGKSKAAMYNQAAANTDTQAMLAKRAGEQNIHATQIDASMQDKQLKDLTKKVMGTQAATGAASGVGGGSVTQADIAQDTLTKEKMDEIAIRYNADSASSAITNDMNNQIWGLGVQKQQYLAAAKNAKQAGNIQALSTILSTVSSTASSGIAMGGGMKVPTGVKKSEAAYKLANPYAGGYKWGGTW